MNYIKPLTTNAKWKVLTAKLNSRIVYAQTGWEKMNVSDYEDESLEYKLNVVKPNEWNGLTEDQNEIRLLDKTRSGVRIEQKWDFVTKKCIGEPVEVPWIHEGNEHLPDIHVERLTPFIFQAKLRPTDYRKGRSSMTQHFLDVDDKFEYSMATKCTNLLLHAIADGTLYVESGGIKGDWTFQKAGTDVSVIPYDSNRDRIYCLDA